MRKLTIQKQIDILKSAKEYYMDHSYNGMCYAINECLPDELKSIHDYDHLHKCIPSFKNNSLTIAGKKGLIPELRPLGFYWWPPRDITIRPKVFDYLIENLEKKLEKQTKNFNLSKRFVIWAQMNLQQLRKYLKL